MPPLAKLPGCMSVLAAPVPDRRHRHCRLPPLKDRAPAASSSPHGSSRTSDTDIRHDVGKVTAGMNKRYTLAAAETLRDSELPILLTWAPGDRLLPDPLGGTVCRRGGQRPDRRDPRLRALRPARPAAAPSRGDRAIHGNGSLSATFGVPKIPAESAGFSSDPGVETVAPRSLQDGESPWPRKSSTRIGRAARWRSASTTPSRAARSGPSRRRAQRRSRLDFSPRASSSSRMIGSAAAVRTQEPRAL